MPVHVIALIAVALVPAVSAQSNPQPAAERQQIGAIVAKIQLADYESDRPALARLREELTPFLEEPVRVSSRVQYWRGFALWRRAMNGVNAAVDPAELKRDLVQAMDDFSDALVRDPSFVDAKTGKASCLAILANTNFRAQQPESRDQIVEAVRLANEAAAAAPENPRALWVQGSNQWATPAQLGGAGQEVARATFARALTFARQQRRRTTDPLEPAWGEPELLMTFAFISLNGVPPDAAAAERYAREALSLVPTWQYLRDILMPQIQKAKAP